MGRRGRSARIGPRRVPRLWRERQRARAAAEVGHPVTPSPPEANAVLLTLPGTGATLLTALAPDALTLRRLLYPRGDLSTTGVARGVGDERRPPLLVQRDPLEWAVAEHVG
ncbi:hypothetical protein GCM10010193_57940 [Kitasatospora atroaurantiaca]|uniref:Uncharacterized protein n=1 Tax=Kitasatospora atroaurantiaca TaxID=285545 RepID=A0A561F1X6_9ACTN|nr:hypothetical protein [Kitasatospora atroaurantiaca]TWE21867.1 hypothetical protein FB465_7105 [Kitasatospora atroaurantiaca]